MRILMLGRPTDTIGGDATASGAYCRELRGMGADVEERRADWLGDFSGYDFVHLWAACSPDWGLPAASAAKQQGKKLIVTSEWWGRELRQSYFYQEGQDIAPGYREAVARTLALADVVFVANMSEAQEVWKLVPRAPVHVIGRGCDKPEVEPQEAQDYVVCLARVERQKNQVTLAHACREIGAPLVLVGGIGDGYYAAQAQALGAQLTGPKPHAEAMRILSRARVHALVSFFEAVGMSTLEAASLGIPCVMGRVGAQVEFFGERGIYADPTDWRDVAAAVTEAWGRPRGKWFDVPKWETVARRGLGWMEANL